VPRRIWKRRTIIIAAFTVALSIGIVFASVPYLPHPPPPHLSLPNSITQIIPAASSPGYPGVNSLKIPNLSNSEKFFLNVNVTNGMAGFCVIEDTPYENWFRSATPPPNSTFPSDSCIVQEQTVQAQLQFLPTYFGTWDVVVLNNNPTLIRVDFSPA
jgi:hypothetical protein